MKKTVFFDRDGTINIEKNYLFRIQDFEYVPGAVDGMKLLSDKGFQIIIITNQSGIARGYYTIDDYYKIDAWMKEDLREKGIGFLETYFCPHLPDAPIKKYAQKCNCRKPGTELFLKAASDWDVDLDHSYAIGDRLRDCEIVKSTNCRGILVGQTEDIDTIEAVKGGKYPGIRYCDSLYDAALLICGDD